MSSNNRKLRYPGRGFQTICDYLPYGRVFNERISLPFSYENKGKLHIHFVATKFLWAFIITLNFEKRHLEREALYAIPVLDPEKFDAASCDSFF